MITRFTLWLFIFGISQGIFSQANPGRLPLIIDTDGAPDDLRAICLLSAIREMEIMAIFSSDGTLDPVSSYHKLRQLAPQLGLDAVVLGAGKPVLEEAPPWRDISESIPWGSAASGLKAKPLPALSLCKNLLDTTSRPVTLVCMGAMTNISDLLKTYPGLKTKIRKILWYNESLEFEPETNYALDPEAAQNVLAAGIPVDVISNLHEQDASWDEGMRRQLGQYTASHANPVIRSFKTLERMDPTKALSYTLWDELLPVYLLYPELFDMKPDPNNPNIAINTAYSVEGAKSRMLQILSGDYPVEDNIVFDYFPIDPEQYAWDVRNRMEEILSRHGREEWKAAVLTNEIHGHLGIYSIVGAKMGIKAMEMLGAGIDQVRVVSFAGSEPPLSCLNDGLQISTGATLGMGTIRLDPGTDHQAMAGFTYKDTTLVLRLKDEFVRQVEEDINRGILQYGNLTDGYWKLIRRLGLKYWAEWDRNKLFELTEK